MNISEDQVNIKHKRAAFNDDIEDNGAVMYLPLSQGSNNIS